MDIISRVNWVDILVVILMARISYVALGDGLSHEIFPLIGTVITATISIRYYHQLALAIENIIKLPISVTNLLCFIALLTVVGLVLKLLKVLVNSMVNVSWHPLLEKGGGLVLGILRSSVVVSTVLITLLLMPFSYLQDSIEGKSLTGRYFIKIVPGISDKINWIFPEVFKK